MIMIKRRTRRKMTGCGIETDEALALRQKRKTSNFSNLRPEIKHLLVYRQKPNKENEEKKREEKRREFFRQEIDKTK